MRTAPAYDRQKALGAQFGQVNGWERPNYYAPGVGDGFDHEARSFRRGGWWPYVEAEAKAKATRKKTAKPADGTPGPKSVSDLFKV